MRDHPRWGVTMLSHAEAAPASPRPPCRWGRWALDVAQLVVVTWSFYSAYSATACRGERRPAHWPGHFPHEITKGAQVDRPDQDSPPRPVSRTASVEWPLFFGVLAFGGFCKSLHSIQRNGDRQLIFCFYDWTWEQISFVSVIHLALLTESSTTALHSYPEIPSKRSSRSPTFDPASMPSMQANNQEFPRARTWRKERVGLPMTPLSQQNLRPL
jgi:hypothetical protein